MAVRLVIFDCDLTLWDHPNVTALVVPFTRIDADTVTDAVGAQVRLTPGAREVLEELRARNILISIASWNQPVPVFALFELFELATYFTRPKVEPHPYKERMIGALLHELAAEGIHLKPDEVLYVDDRALHLRRVCEAHGPIRTLCPGADICDFREVVRYID